MTLNKTFFFEKIRSGGLKSRRNLRKSAKKWKISRFCWWRRRGGEGYVTMRKLRNYATNFFPVIITHNYDVFVLVAYKIITSFYNRNLGRETGSKRMAKGIEAPTDGGTKYSILSILLIIFEIEDRKNSKSLTVG